MSDESFEEIVESIVADLKELSEADREMDSRLHDFFRKRGNEFAMSSSGIPRYTQYPFSAYSAFNPLCKKSIHDDPDSTPQYYVSGSNGERDWTGIHPASLALSICIAAVQSYDE